MTPPEVLEVLRSMVLQLCPQLGGAVPDEHAPLMDGDAGLDSVALMELISAIETRWDFQFDETDLRPSSFASLAALTRVVAPHVASR
jgi:acyl carrier protein